MLRARGAPSALRARVADITIKGVVPFGDKRRTVLGGAAAHGSFPGRVPFPCVLGIALSQDGSHFRASWELEVRLDTPWRWR